jgi:hypothetical protein
VTWSGRTKGYAKKLKRNTNLGADDQIDCPKNIGRLSYK